MPTSANIYKSPISSSSTNKINDTPIDRWPVLRRYNNLKTEGLKWYATWRELSQYLNPTRGFFFNQVPNYGIKIDHSIVLDSYARRCIRDLASGMISGLTSPSRPWFKLGLEDKDLGEYAPVKEYLDECQNRMHSVMAHSNVYECFNNVYEEIATFGTASMFLLEDFNDVIRGRSFTIGEYFLGAGMDCRVNTFCRQYWMTVAQLVKEFGFEQCSPTVRNDFRVHNTERWVRVIHLIEENDNRLPEYKDWANMAYRSLYFEDNSMQNTYLRTEGFEEFPVMSPRWALTTTADVYGRSPGWDVLGDDKMLQKEQREKLLILAKIGNPPMQVDASVQNVNTLPGGVTRSSSMLPNAGVRPAYQISPDINAMREDILEVKKALDDAFHRDLFRMLLNEASRPANVTATEIAEKQAERLNMVSPVIMKLNNELLNPFISRVFNIMLRHGLLPDITPELNQLIGGMDLKPQYISVLAQAQRMIGITAMEQNFGFGMNMAQANPDVLDNYNFDENAQEYARSLGVPAKVMNSPDKIAQIRAEKAKQKAQMAQAQNMAMTAELAAKGAKATKDMGTTPMGENSALDGLLAGVKGQ